MREFGTNLIAALDNFFGREVRARDLVEVAWNRYEHDISDYAYWRDMWEVLAPLAALRSEPTDGLRDAFSLEPQWFAITRLMTVRSRADYAIADVRRSVNRMKAYLLYYPRVVVSCYHDLTESTWEHDELHPGGIRRFGNAAAWTLPQFLVRFAPLVELRPLVEKGIIVVAPLLDDSHVPRIEELAEETAVALRASLARLRRSVLVSAIAQMTFEREASVEQRYVGQARALLVEEAATLFAREITACETLGANYVADSHAIWTLVSRYLGVHNARTETREVDQRIAALLGVISLPNINTLSTSDLLSIRLQDDAFEGWRIALRGVLRHFAGRQISPGDFEFEFKRVAEEHLVPAARLLRSTPSLQGVIANGTLRLALAVTAGLGVGTMFGSPLAGALGGAAQRVALEAYEVANVVRRAKAQGPILRHYSSLLTGDH